jgi:hypothetical protein
MIYLKDLGLHGLRKSMKMLKINKQMLMEMKKLSI